MSVATALTRARRGLLAFIAVAGLSFAGAGALGAQGVTTGAMRGRVLDQQGAPIGGATLQLVNRNSGTRFIGTTSTAGTFFIPNVIVGPYVIEARAIGYRPAGRTDILVTLGQVADVELRLEATAVELEAISVTGAGENDLLSRGRTGATALVSERMIENLPSLSRNFNDMTRTSALVNGRSIAGQADRFNALQIDGGSNGDLFGLNASGGSPGGRNDSRALSVEAVRELQVLIAPFDVRQSGFIGGLVNAVTKSGTNQFHGSAFGFLQDNRMQGKDSLGVGATEFNRRYYGFSLGGPIVRDRFHFFAAAEWRSEEQLFNSFASGVVRNISDADTINFSTTAGLSARTAERVRQFAINSLGFDPGDWRRPLVPNPDRNIFLKLTGQLGSRTQLELSYNNVQSELLVVTHDPFGANPTRLREGYQYSGSGYTNTSKNSSIRARLNSQISSSLTNETILSTYRVEDVRALQNRVTLMVVGADSAGAHLALGAERFSQANTLDQNILELANNLTLSMNDHVFTLGGRAERFKFNNVFFPASLGAWYFPDTTTFFAGTPTRYERALPGVFGDSVLGRTDGPIANFTFNAYGLYGQDQWRATRGLTLTMGLRVDFTSLPAPAYNPRIDTSNVTVGPRTGQDFGVRTDSRPTNATLVSPRFGFNYDASGDQSLLIRGGAGIFSGRTPYVWASNAYTNTGLEQLQLTCTATGGPGGTSNVPTFTTDADNQPTACSPSTVLALPRPAIVFFTPGFKLPQQLRFALGVDRRLPWGMVGTIDLIYSKAINQFLLEDVNLVEGGTSSGEASRRLYGTLSTTSSSSTPRRATTAANDVLRQYNSNQDYTYSATIQLTKRFLSDLEFSAQYAYMRSYDLMSPTSDISNSLLNFATLDGLMNDRRLTPSFFDTPHNIRLSGTAGLPYGFRVGLFYSGSSGRPFAYRYNSDVNGDGFSGNDLFYVPANFQDIALVNVAGGTLTPQQLYNTLDAFIQGEECLRESRGKIMSRNSCRNPWRSFLDMRVAKSFSTLRGQNVELTANMFNLLSFLGIGGEIRGTSGNENIALLNRTGYSNAIGRGTYSLLLPTRNSIDVLASRWKLELGARYSF